MNPLIIPVHRKLTSLFTITATALLLMLAMSGISANAQTATNFSHASATATPSSENGLGVNNVGSLQQKWVHSETDDTATYRNPVVANGVVYVGGGGNNHNYIYALNESTGELQWSYAAGGPILTDPVVANGTVYFSFGSSVDSEIYALNASTGAKRWSFYVNTNEFPPPDFELASELTVANGVVYAGVYDVQYEYASLYALNASTGATLWNLPWSASNFVSTPIVAANGAVYFNNVAVSAANGAPLLSFDVPGGPASGPVVANGVVYFCSDPLSSPSQLLALNASTGKTLWAYTIPSEIGGALVVKDGVIYVGAHPFPGVSGPAHLFAVNASTGKTLWNYVVPVAQFSIGLTVVNGVIYTITLYNNGSGSDSGNLVALDASTGKLLYSHNFTGDRLGLSSPAVTNEGVYFAENVYTAASTEFPTLHYLYAFSIGADLLLRAMPSATTVHPGDLLTYTFPVWNVGPANADHEVLNTQVPPGTAFDYVRISGTPGLGTCTTPPYGGTGQIVCHQNGSMTPNTTWTVRLTVKVTASSGTTVTENAATMSDTPDPNLSNNTATVNLKVQ